MKKIITSSLIALLFMSFYSVSFSQGTDDKDYSNKKFSFWTQYLNYKSGLANGISSFKPTDPSGLFYIDENNNFVQNNSKSVIETNYNNAPWIGGQQGDAVSGYTFSQSTTTYTPAYGGTLLCSGGCDDSYHSGIALPFSFTYNGTAYTTISVQHNGWMQFGTTTPSGYSPICTGSYPNVIAAFARDLYGLASGDSLRYLTTGSTPNRVFIIEWSKWGIFSSGLNEIDFMIKLYETTNQIQIVYKPETPTTSITDVQVGLMGATNADFNTRTTTTNWSATTAGVACSYNYFNSSVYPPNGLTFTWSPPPTGPMGYYSSTTNQLLNGAPVAPNSVNNQIIQIVVNDTGTTSPLFVNSLKLTTSGSNNPVTDIANAKLYYTRSSSTFNTTRQYGSTITSPNGAMYFTDTASLDPNAGNYFWLTYDITAGAVIGDSVDATCDSLIVGTTAYAPTVSAPAGSRPIDPYCLGTVSNAGCPYGLYITNVLFGAINNTSGCNPNLPYCYDRYLNLSTQVRQNNSYLITVTNQNIGNPNPTAFGIWVDWNNNSSFADGGEYFATTVIPANTTTVATATIIVPAGAVLGNRRMRIRTNLSTPPGSGTYCSNLSYGEQEDYTVAVLADTNMTYTSSTTTQTNTSNVYTPSNNTQIIGIQVDVFGTISPISATSFSLSTAGSTNPATDISNAKIWYTGNSAAFATTTLVGTTLSPNGVFTVSGSQQLLPGINYFWLTYNVPSSAVSGDTLDAQCNSITVGGIARIPSPTSPAGFRIISGTSMSGIYTIPGSYPNFTTAIADLNARGIYGPVTFNVAPGFVDTAVNLVINTTGTAANPIIFKNAGTSDAVNPIIIAGVGTSTTTDGIIKLNGVDYITFNGIDLQENPANTTTTMQMEWGYALVKPDGTNGSQNNTITGCTVTLNKTNTAAVGIYSGNHSAISTTTFALTSTAGASSNNSFTNNTITNAYIGISINGYADGSPYTLYDQNNVITGNNITNYGGAAVTAYGVYNIYQNGLNLSNNTINSTGGVNSTATLYGIFCSTMNNSNLTIANNTVTIAGGGTTSSIYAINFGNSSAGTTNNINILNNTVQNCTYATATSGAMYHIYCNATTKSLTVSGNRIIGNTYGSATSTGVSYSLYNLNASIDSTRILNNLDSGNTVLGTTAYSLYRMANAAASNRVIIEGNRIKNNIVNGTTTTATQYGIYNTGGTFSNSLSNNIVSNNTLNSTSSASMYFIYNSVSTPLITMSNNTVSTNTSNGTGTLYSIYNGGTANTGITVTNNNVNNQQKLTATGTGTIYGIYITGSGLGPVNINNNSVTGFTSAAATVFYGIYHVGSPPNVLNINNNNVGNFTTGGASIIYGIYTGGTTTTQATISQDSIYNLTSLGGTIYGLYIVNGNPVNTYKNVITGISSTTGTTAVVYGMYIGGGTINNIYNNFISDIKAPASTSISPAVSGIYAAGGTYDYLYYNTVFIKAQSTSATTFSTSALYASTTPNLDLRNNIFADSSTPGPTGGNSVAYRRSSATLTSYLNTSNNNCFYTGPPAANRLIFYDGTNSDQTLAAYKTRVVPRDNNSISENPPFVNKTTPPYDLRILTSVGTQLESGGQIISAPLSIVDDKFGVARYPNAGYPVGGFTPVAPDIGANEFGGLNADTVPPFISYAALGNGGTTNRTFPNVIITDANGVNTTPGTKPRCYYKRSIDSNVVNDTTNLTDGWKYVEAAGTTSPFTFVIDYSKLVGGTGVTAGQIIQYFVIAQDLSTSSNVGWNQATFALNPASVNLVNANAPIANTLSYTIVSNVFSGSYNVGSAELYTSLTGAGGLFASINAGVVSGNITAVITTDLSEDGTNGLNPFNEIGAGGYTLRIVPSSAAMKTISGAVANGMIRLSARRVIIDGNGGFAASNKISLNGDNPLAPTKYLTFRNTNGANPTFTFINDAVRDTIKNCIIESNNTSTASGTILFSTTTGTQGNDSNVIMYCDIRDRSDAAGTPANGIYSSGTTTTFTQYNNFNKIIGCNIYNNFYDLSAVTSGIYLVTGSSDWTIDSCSFYQTATRTAINSSTFSGIYSGSTLNNNILITNNYFGGTAPQCGGTAMTFNGAGLYNYYGIYLTVGNLAVTSLQGNTIQNIDLTTSPASSLSTFFRGIYVPTTTSWVNIGNVSGNTIGAGTGTGSILLTTNTTTSSYTLCAIQHLGFGSIYNSVIGSMTFAGNSLGTGDLYAGIYWSNTTAGQIYNISNNLIGSLTTANSIQATNLLDGQSLRGMFLLNGAGTINNISNNIVANLTSFNTATATTSSVYGIQQNSATNGLWTFTNNTVRNLINNTNALTTSFMLLGISSPATGTNTFSQNTVYSLYANGTGAGYQLVGGFLCGGTTGGTVSRNKVYDLRFNGTGVLAPYPLILGINVQSTGQYILSNNMISLTNGDPSYMNPVHNEEFKQVVVENPPVNLSAIQRNKTVTEKEQNEYIESLKNINPIAGAYDGPNPKNKINNEVKNEPNLSTINATLAGIYHTNTNPGPVSYFYNSFYVGGTSPAGGTLNSYAFLRTSTGMVNLRNNLMINARTGGTGVHFAVGNEGSNPLFGWNQAASNYNVFLGSNAAAIGEWGLANNQTYAQWVASSGGDKQSWSTTTGTIIPANLVTNIGTCDLTIQSGNTEAWLVSGKGIALGGVNNDYTGDARVTTIAGGCTDIGADEFTATPPSNPAASQVGTPGAGSTTNYVLFGRTVCSIDWGFGGSSYPPSMNVNYYSGINPVNPATLGNSYSNSYWTVNPASGSFSGTTYDITFNFGDNETYTISSPSTNTILGKYNNFWEAFLAGSGSLNSELNWSGLSVKTRGLSNFSSFTLTDNTLAVQLISPPNNATFQPASLTLVWSKSAAATSYRVQLATDSLFTSLVVNDSTVTDTTRLVSGLTLNIPYFWRVQGKNSTITGPYSPYFKFTTGTPLSAPPPPVLSSPANGITGLPLLLNLLWLTAPTAATYRVQVATDSLFTSLIVDDSTVTDTTKALSGLTPLTVYYWRVNAKNTVGTSAYSSVWNFKTVGSPLQVTLANPPNNTVNTPVSVTCLWNKAGEQTALSINPVKEKTKDNNELIINYWFELTSDTVSFANLQRDTTLTDTLKFAAGLQNAVKYYWRVKAKNETGWGPFSVWWNFTTIIAAPILVSPLNNSVGNPPSLTVVWRLTQTATTYRVQVATDSLFTTLIVNDSTVTDTTKAVSGLSPQTFYWWRVNAKNVNGAGAYSPVWKFKVMGLPTQVVLASPANGATNQPVSITFLWRKSADQTLSKTSNNGRNKGERDNPEAISNYWYELVTDTVSMANLVRDSLLTDTTKVVSGLVNATTYYWHVRAKNQVGWGQYSVWWRFTTLPLGPAQVTLTVIPGGFYNTSTGRLNMRDTIKAMLIDSSGCLRSDSTRAVLDSVTFTATISFANVNTGNYYLYIFHRNHIFISSRYEQSVVRGSTVSYNFTNDSTKAFGNTLIRVSSAPLLYGMIPGDANRDGFVDGLDQTIWLAQNGLDGYLSADFNGDLFVDGLDQTIWLLYNGQSYFVPCELTFENPIDHTRRVKEIYNKQIEDIFSPKQNKR